MLGSRSAPSNSPPVLTSWSCTLGPLSKRLRSFAQVHARPATVGQVAQSAKAKILVLSHFIKAPSVISTPQWFSLFNLGDSIAEVRKTFSGLIEAAEDLQCIRIP